MAIINENKTINLNLSANSTDGAEGSYTIESSVRVANDYANGGNLVVEGGFTGIMYETPYGANPNVINKNFQATKIVAADQAGSANNFLQLFIQSPGSPYAPILTSGTGNTALYTQYYFDDSLINITKPDFVTYTQDYSLNSLSLSFSIQDEDTIVNQDYILGGAEEDDIEIGVFPGLVAGTLNAYLGDSLANWVVFNGAEQIVYFQIEESGLTYSHAVVDPAYDWINVSDYNSDTNMLTVVISAQVTSGDRIGYIELFSTTNTSSQYNFRIGINQGPGLGVVISGSTLNLNNIVQVVPGVTNYITATNSTEAVAQVEAGFTTQQNLQIQPSGAQLTFTAFAVGDDDGDLQGNLIPVGAISGIPHPFGLSTGQNAEGNDYAASLCSHDGTSITNVGGVANNSWLTFISHVGNSLSTEFVIQVEPNDTAQERNAIIIVENSLDSSVTDTITISQAAGYNPETDTAVWLYNPTQLISATT